MNPANTTAVQVVQGYLEDLKRTYVHPWRSSEFAQLSYLISATEDILYILNSNKDTPPLILIEEYRDLMNEYACIHKFNSFMFSVAADAATDICDTLLKAF